MARCVRCQLQAKEKDKYCRRCGAPLINRCTNDGGPFGDPCHKVNDEDAVFCAACGSYTSFYKAGLLEAGYPENKSLDADELNEFNHFQHKFFME